MLVVIDFNVFYQSLYQLFVHIESDILCKFDYIIVTK